MDEYGEVIILLPNTNLLTENELKNMITLPPSMIRSKIKLDYHYILKQLLVKEISGDEEIFDYIIKNINKTFFGKEKNITLELNKKKLEELELELNKIIINEDNYLLYKNVKNLEEEIKSSGLLNYKMVKKMQKQLKKDRLKLKKMTSKEINNFRKYYVLEIKINKIKEIINFDMNSSRIHIKMICDYLVQNNLLTLDYNFTPLGRIVAEVNECNPLILGYIIENNILDNLEFPELMALLSIFIIDFSIEESFIINLPITEDLKNIMYNIGEITDNFQKEEDELNQNIIYNIYSDWDISTSIFEAVYKWCEGKSWREVSLVYPTFEGNFIKNIIRLSNLAKNVYSIAKLTKNTKLINIMDGFEEKLIRDFVTIESLYL